MDKTIWVKSANGKSIHLIDMRTPHPTMNGEKFYLAISEKEARAGKSKEVPANAFFMGMIAQGVIAAGDAPKRGPKPKEVENEKK